jgi:phage regulator Rha-like protein
MSLLTVSDRGDGILMVDSRLVASELGIQHKNFLATIEKYNSLMASNSAMGAVAFETREFQTKRGNVSCERWAWLTELQATFIMTLSRNTEQVVNCKLALAVAFDKAKQVIKEVIPAQAQEIERLKLEVQVAQAQEATARTQERLMQATNAIASLHGTGMVALILGKPDAVITHTEVIEKTIAVDAKGRVLAQSDGLTIGYLTKRLGFKNNEQTWQWLNSVQLGKDSGVWSRELTAHPTLKLPRHLLPQIQRLFAYQVGNRQLLLGEGGGR